MKIPFYKYQGTGNDFVIINQLVVNYFNHPDPEVISRICSRRFGIGADGLILLVSSDSCDFKMIYYNSDGRQSTMCGNGGRCIVHLARQIKLFKEKCTFEAIDGIHEAHVLTEDIIELKMNDVPYLSEAPNATTLDTGSPHYVTKVSDLDVYDVYGEGRKIRFGETYSQNGINVNFIEDAGNRIKVRTYERGVEDETYSCGTGVTAAALVASEKIPRFRGQNAIPVSTKGGDLSVRFEKDGGGYKNIWLMGPVRKVFEGSWEL